MKTARLNLLVSPQDKAAITARAAALNLSTSELIRRAVSAYEPERNDDELRALAEVLLQTVSRTEEALEAAVARLDRLEERVDCVRLEARESARKSGEAWPFSAPFPEERRVRP